MKNIIVLTILVIIICAVFPNNSVYCQESGKYEFTVGTQLGFVYGQAIELVYPTDTMGELLSELKWDMKPVFYYGVHLDFSRNDISAGPGFFSSLSFKMGIPSDSGTLENRDWMSTENSALTHFSSHTNRTNEFYWLDAALGATIPVADGIYIKPFLSTSWMRFGFSARDGYGIYARANGSNKYHPIEDDPELKDFTGQTVITYEQNWFIVAAGFGIGTTYPFTIDTSFLISPLVFCTAVDEHLSKGTTYVDFPRWGLFVEQSMRMSFDIKQIILSLDFSYRYITNSKGATYIKSNGGEFFRSRGESGAGLSLMSIGLLARLRL